MCGPEASLRNGSNHAECDSVHAGGGSKNFLGGGGKSSNDISADDVAPGAAHEDAVRLPHPHSRTTSPPALRMKTQSAPTFALPRAVSAT